MLELLKLYCIIFLFKLFKMFLSIKNYLFPVFEIKRKIDYIDGPSGRIFYENPVTLSQLIHDAYGNKITIYFTTPSGIQHKLEVHSGIIEYTDKEIVFNTVENRESKDPLKYDVDIDTMLIYVCTYVSKDGLLVHS